MKIDGLTSHNTSGIIGGSKSLLSISKLVNHAFFPVTLTVDFQAQLGEPDVFIALSPQAQVALIQQAQQELDELYAQVELNVVQHQQYLQSLLEQLALVQQMILAPDDALAQLRDQQYRLLQQQLVLLRQNLPQ